MFTFSKSTYTQVCKTTKQSVFKLPDSGEKKLKNGQLNAFEGAKKIAKCNKNT